MRFFESREESDSTLEAMTDPSQTPEEQLAVVMAAQEDGGEITMGLLSLRSAVQLLTHGLSGGSGNEVHDMRTVTRMREPLAKLNLALESVMEGAKDVVWGSEICDCQQCKHADKVRNASNN